MRVVTICKIVDCDRIATCRELCSRHYSNFWYSDEFFVLLTRKKPKAECSVERCDKPAVAKGYCTRHYDQWRNGRNLTILGDVVHGTIVGYQRESCRCELCTKAYLEMRQRRNSYENAHLAAYMVEFRAERLELVSQIKLKSGCVDCGYNEHSEALEFDHIDPLGKVFEIGRAARGRVAWDRVLAEMDKCEIRCVNCHRLRTVEQNARLHWGYSDMVAERIVLTNQLKLDQGCFDCGYNEHAGALQFDHIDPKTKKNNVSTLLRGSYSWQVVSDEIEKCEIRCANCHRMRSVAQKRNGEF